MPDIRTIISAVADVYQQPDLRAPRGKMETQLVFGEKFVVERETDDWFEGHCTHDGYKGFLQKHHLKAGTPPATHIVNAVRSPCYREASIKSFYIRSLSFGSLVTAVGQQDGFTHLDDGNWVYSKHLTAVDSFEKDPVAVATKFIETPYYWGGRSGFGIDCSGLMQVCFARSGISIPRDTEQQISLGVESPHPRHGDMVFFKGHVGIMKDEDILIHANAFHMKVVAEPLWMVDERAGGAITARRL